MRTPTKQNTQHSDAKLLEKIVLRTPDWQLAFTELFERYQQDIYGRAFALLGERTFAEDIVQEVFIRLYRFAHQYDGQSSFKTWLIRITENQCYTLLNGQRKQAAKMARFQVLNTEDELTDTLAEINEHPEHAKIRRFLPLLDSKIRDILYLRYWLELTLPQISTLLGISLSASKMRLSRAQTNFRQVLLSG